ncbi:hypothetical protein [Halorubellus sp. PRR65]|uniref:hypothetical protein n=1 Tax=Halorubellus sp. PRR65 TaxID=3098148 RepID=UPI002B2615EC|nr:hypothetical protein [Halorubellus sp. PRR65]
MDRPSTRRVVAALVLAAVAVSLVLPALGGPPTVTVENHDRNRTYRVTAYAVPDVERPSALSFHATTDDHRERVPFEAVYWSGDNDYRNVTVATPSAANETAIVPAGGNATVELDGYDREPTVVYVVELADSERVVHVDTTQCSEPDQTVTVAMQDGDFQNGTAVCA